MTLTKVLLVDDEPAILSNISEAMSLAQFDVVTATSHQSAEEALETHDIELVLIDLRLPDGDGLDLARSIRARMQIPIIMMSGKADDIDRIVGLELVADDYLQKPFLHRELIARVRAILRRYGGDPRDLEDSHSSNTSSVVEFHDFALNRTTRSLNRIDGTDVELTTREFDVLSVLVERKGSVLSRQEIYTAAGIGKGLADRQIDGLISRLRTKLYAANEAGHKIKTVHGRGYVLTAE